MNLRDSFVITARKNGKVVFKNGEGMSYTAFPKEPRAVTGTPSPEYEYVTSGFMTRCRRCKKFAVLCSNGLCPRCDDAVYGRNEVRK